MLTSENLSTGPLVRVQIDFLADKLILDPLARIDKWTFSNLSPLICGKPLQW